MLCRNKVLQAQSTRLLKEHALCRRSAFIDVNQIRSDLSSTRKPIPRLRDNLKLGAHAAPAKSRDVDDPAIMASIPRVLDDMSMLEDTRRDMFSRPWALGMLVSLSVHLHIRSDILLILYSR